MRTQNQTQIQKATIQSGFTLIETIITVALLAVIGVAAYYAYQNQHVYKTPAVIYAPTATPNAAVGNNLNIAQFGVGMTVPSGLMGLTYTYTPIAHKSDATGKPYTVPATVSFISSQLKSQASKCTDYDGSIGSLTRDTVQPTNPEGSPYTGELVKKIGNLYYNLGLPNGGPCFDGSLGQTESTQRQLIQQAFATLH